jgi:hypothetical protein
MKRVIIVVIIGGDKARRDLLLGGAGMGNGVETLFKALS